MSERPGTIDPLRDADAARRCADALARDRSFARRPLGGVPIAVKDNICTREGHTTCASRMLEHWRSPYDAEVIERLHAAGAIVVGKTNLDEFAMGSSTENSAFGPTRNPRDPERAPGGSSGGSAAAVAAGFVPVALGSDTGGSIRQPASFCGVVGFKPTWGRVSRRGLVAFASSLDQIGPFARTVRDAARVYEVIAGRDPLDATSLARPVEPVTPRLEEGARGLRVGVPRAFLEQAEDPGVCEHFDRALTMLREAGAEIVDVDLPHARFAVAAYYVVANAEASANLARFDGVRYGFRASGADDVIEMYTATRARGFGAEVKRRILLGTYVLSAGYYDAYYRRAMQVRSLIIDDFRSAFERCDLVALPTSPTPAFRLGERLEDPLTMYLSDVFTIPVNLAGLPAASVPAGECGGLPVGVQLIGRALDEATVLRGAAAVEAGASGEGA